MMVPIKIGTPRDGLPIPNKMLLCNLLISKSLTNPLPNKLLTQLDNKNNNKPLKRVFVVLNKINNKLLLKAIMEAINMNLVKKKSRDQPINNLNSLNKTTITNLVNNLLPSMLRNL